MHCNRCYRPLKRINVGGKVTWEECNCVAMIAVPDTDTIRKAALAARYHGALEGMRVVLEHHKRLDTAHAQPDLMAVTITKLIEKLNEALDVCEKSTDNKHYYMYGSEDKPGVTCMYCQQPKRRV